MTGINPDIFCETDLCGLDIETKDTNLKAQGPGCWRNDGHIVGVSFATDDAAQYYPLKHPDTTAEQRQYSVNVINEVIRRQRNFVGANIKYDLDWLQSEKFDIPEYADDVQVAEPLIDEYRRSYSLEYLSELYGEEAKATKILVDYCQLKGWNAANPRALIWKMPQGVVAHYGEMDGMLPVRIFRKQKKELANQGLEEVYDIEKRLLPLLLQMRKTGVRLDIPMLRKTSLAMVDKLDTIKTQIYDFSGYAFNVGSTAQLAKLFDKHNIPYPYNQPTPLMLAKQLRGNPGMDPTTAKGNPNIDKHVLGKLAEQYPIAKKILEYRHFDTLIDMFMLPYLGFMNKDGRLHCSFNQLPTDDYGAVSGRFSSSRPNLQQVPGAKEDPLDDNEDAQNVLAGKIIRKLFIPEEDCDWGKLDYSQVEYRITAHYAVGPGADELRESYVADPNTDYHQRIQDLTGFPRGITKRLNFGLAYGMGIEKTAAQFGWSVEDATAFVTRYHEKAPYLKATRRAVMQKAEKAGYIYTLLGRRARIHYSRKTHSFFNRLIQGSAADVMKKAMVDAYEKGLFTVLHPHITVHDELDVSIPRTKEGKEALQMLKETMENAITLRVPLIVDCGVGPNWGEVD